LLLLAGVGNSIWDGAAYVVGGYIKPVAQQMAVAPGGANATGMAAPLEYPGIAQSVIEAQNVSMLEMLSKMHPWPWLVILGFAGFTWVIWRRPVALFLAPLIILALSAVKLGTRMTMFGGPAVGLGVALPLLWLVGRLVSGKRWATPTVLLSQALLAFIAVLPYGGVYPNLDATPVLSKFHCMALKGMPEYAPPDSMVWTWWDWGYATHYYAERLSFADGGRHGGEHVYTLGRAMTSPSPLQVRQLINYSAMHDYAPWTTWQGRSAEDMEHWMADLAVTDHGYKAPHKQYFIVAWENVRLMPWISFYGSWDFTTASGVKGWLGRMNQPFDFNRDRGAVYQTESGEGYYLKTIDILGATKAEHLEYAGNTGPHLLWVPHVGAHFLLDDTIYNSMMVQLLISAPDDPRFKDHFTLVAEGYPVVRIYEVR